MKQLILIIIIVFSGILLQAQSVGDSLQSITANPLFSNERDVKYSTEIPSGEWVTIIEISTINSGKVKIQFASGDYFYSNGYVWLNRYRTVDEYHERERKKAHQKFIADSLSTIAETEVMPFQRKVDSIKLEAQKEEELITQKRIQEEKEEEAYYRKKYGDQVYNQLEKGYIWLGITEEMAIVALGSPLDINSSVNANGAQKQYIYDNKYLYFENGKLTGWQD